MQFCLCHLARDISHGQCPLTYLHILTLFSTATLLPMILCCWMDVNELSTDELQWFKSAASSGSSLAGSPLKTRSPLVAKTCWQFCVVKSHNIFIPRLFTMSKLKDTTGKIHLHPFCMTTSEICYVSVTDQNAVIGRLWFLASVVPHLPKANSGLSVRLLSAWFSY